MRRTLVALVAVSLLAACAPAGTIPAAASAGQVAWGARLSCTTTSAGVCTVPHDMGVTPDGVTAVLADRAGFAQVTGKSPTGITLKAIKSVNSSGTPTVWASVSITFEITAAYTPVAPTTPPTTSPTTPPTTAPTTAPTTPSTTAPAAGWPDASNTGVPAGTTLTAYTGPCTITTNGAVVDAKTVNCDLVIRAANVSITNSKVNGGVWLAADEPGGLGWSASVTDSEVARGVEQMPTICCANLTVLRANVHGGEGAVQCETPMLFCKVTDSWLHGQQLPDTANWHLDGFLSDGTDGASCSGTWCIELVHNRIVCDHPANSIGEGCTGDISLIPNFSTISRVRVANNMLGANTGSAYCTYGGEKPSSPYPHADHVVYENNVFEPGTNGICAAYGPVNAFNVNGVGNVWTNNTWTTGGIVPPVD